MTVHALPGSGSAPDESTEKLLPCNTDAERNILDSMLINPSLVASIAGLLEPGDFYRNDYRTIYAAMLALHAAQEPVDATTLFDQLDRTGTLEDAGGIGAIFALGTHVPTSMHALSYARIVRRCARNRALIEAAGKIAALAYNGADDDMACELALREVMRVAQRGSTSGQSRTKSFADVLDDLANEVLDRIDSDAAIGLPTGFAEIDRHVVSMEPGDLIYLAGRPGSGKSALGLKIALMTALHFHATDRVGTVDVVTLEMSAKQQARRVVADRAELNTRYIRSGFRQKGRDPDLDAWNTFEAHRAWLRERVGDRLFVTDGVVSLLALRSLIQRAVTERHCQLVVIDQLDLFADGADRDEYDRITKMSRQLKQIAKSCGVTILCLVQLNRKCEDRRNKRPMLSDLRQSGQLEQDADMVWALYRPAYYDKTNTDARFQQFAELLILKGRDVGDGTMVPLRFEAEYTRFRDWPFDSIPDDPTRDTGNPTERKAD
ncbi:MAG TPA: DnaB-like helicase C-terminal domain-containing protein [Ktedonobacterales bacterium]|nr:DnaB-like helicase C-terminal domain-containing protein [Ktedonobacterales bacterium]